MPRHVLTTQERSKGGKRTASTHDMREIGRKGLQGLANRHFDGNIKRAGRALSTIGNFVTDPFPLNGAWRDPIFNLPPSLLALVLGHCETSDEGAPF